MPLSFTERNYPAKNGWADEYGRIYLYYPITEVVELLHCGRQKAVNTLRELQDEDLISIKNGTTRDITLYQTQGRACGGVGSPP